MKSRSILNEFSLLILWLLVAAIVYASVTGWMAGNGLGGGWNWIKTKFSVAPPVPDLGAAVAAGVAGAAGGINSTGSGLSGIGSSGVSGVDSVKGPR
jgi:hypothetical protein